MCDLQKLSEQTEIIKDQPPRRGKECDGKDEYLSQGCQHPFFFESWIRIRDLPRGQSSSMINHTINSGKYVLFRKKGYNHCVILTDVSSRYTWCP